MELTKQQRNEIYKFALIDLDRLASDGHYFGLCNRLYNALCKVEHRASFYIGIFPEICSLKPLICDNESFWFPCDESGYQKRREILLQAIEETK